MAESEDFGKTEELGKIEDVEVEPLTDQDLEGVPGGVAGATDQRLCTQGCSSFSCPC
jgi:hypothetical protein